MSSRIQNSTKPHIRDFHDCQSQCARGLSDHSTAHVRRLAALVATGDLSVPADLSGEQLHGLIQRVKEHRRERLVKHIARAIADDIVRSRESS